MRLFCEGLSVCDRGHTFRHADTAFRTGPLRPVLGINELPAKVSAEPLRMPALREAEDGHVG
jgi:hypothetical protein